MNKYLITLSLFLIFHLTWCQSGKVLDDLSLPSKVLKMDRKYAIYLPPDYDSSQRSYPVLYLLHGATDDHTGWVQFGEVLHITDKAIRDGIATPMIIVMPDADTKQMGYYNLPDGSWNYEDFFFDEFMPYIESTYRIKQQKRYRAVAGLSMGGGGSFTYALHRPDLFQSACPLSALTDPADLEDAKQFFEWYNIKEPKEEGLTKFHQQYGVVWQMENLPIDDLKSVRWFIDCGDDDFLYEGNAKVHIAMRQREIPHEFRIRDGGHTWTYWRKSLPEVLKFVSQGFHQY
ncbi:MAG: esterase family protein [Cyclobacteriaceae bacterium]